MRALLATLTAAALLTACGGPSANTRGDGTVTRTSDIVREPRPKAPDDASPPPEDSPLSEERDW